MKCPVCRIPTARVMYEGFMLPHCMQCKGHLVSCNRVEFIKGRRTKTLDELQAEVLAASGADAVEKLRCPGCNRMMEKLKEPPPADFYYDQCQACQWIWFDGGELARLKLTYQISQQGKEAAELQRRLREMTPERRAEFEANLAALPVEEDEVAGLLRSALAPRDQPPFGF